MSVSIIGHSQIHLTLQEVITMAKEKSNDALLAKNRYENGYWKFIFYKSDYLPLLSFNATAPDLSRAITKITLPNGNDVFVNRSVLNSAAGLKLSQNFGPTGANIFLNTGLERIDLLGENATTSYLGTPVQLGFVQPLFAFNELRWKRRIEPLRYEEAQRQYREDIEAIHVKATDLFFQLLNASSDLMIAETNRANNDTLYQISKGRFELGKIAENELLQMELALLNAGAGVEQALMDANLATFELKSFLRFSQDETTIELTPPTDIPNFVPSVEKAIAEAKKNRMKVISLERELLEAQQEVARTQRGSRINGNLFATYSLSRSSFSLKDVYANPQDNEVFRMGLQLPVLDWGRAKARIKIALTNQELVKATVDQQRIDFEREIFLKVAQFNMERIQLAIAVKSDTVAQKRYEVSKQRYKIGKIGITDLNIALQEKDRERRTYISRLHRFWLNYYDLRKSTGYDFEKDAEILH